MTSRKLATGGPWTLEDRLRHRVMLLLAVGLCVAGWWQASAKGELALQMGDAALAIVGAILAFHANAMWLLRGRRAISTRFGRLDRARSALPNRGNATSPGPRGPYLAIAELTRYHRPGCQLVDGKQTTAASQAQHERARRKPCGVCRP